MDQDEDFLVVMVEFISSSQGIFFPEPSDLSMNETNKRLLVQLVASYHRQV